MRRWAVAGLAAALLIPGCGDIPLPPKSVRAAYDLMSQAVSGKASFTRCWTSERLPDGSSVKGMDEPRNCYHYGPSRRIRGVYIDEFEGQRFLENASAGLPLVATDKVWLDLDQHSNLERTPKLARHGDGTTIWLVDLIGRKTEAPKGGYGHMGGSDAEVLVDTMISAQPVAQFPGYVPDTLFSRTTSSDNPH